MKKLTIEINKNFIDQDHPDKEILIKNLGLDNIKELKIMMPPNIGDENYWLFRVNLYKDQSIIGFPKFYTIGIGFMQEEDWNTNLPYTCPALEIFTHIKENKKYPNISNTDCIRAIKLIQKHAELFKPIWKAFNN